MTAQPYFDLRSRDSFEQTLDGARNADPRATPAWRVIVDETVVFGAVGLTTRDAQVAPLLCGLVHA